MNNSEIHFLIIDWGTTNFRAFAMGKHENVVAQHEQKLGLLQVENRQFADTLAKVLSDWLGEYQHLKVYMAGMVGSAQGWVEAPYVCAPLSLTELAGNVCEFKLPWGACATLVPGVSYCNTQGDYDVMRGEEVQLFGLQARLQQDSYCAVFPGTHSKHVLFENGKLTAFSTYMTGEVFSLLINQSILGRALPEPQRSNEAFLKGVADSAERNLLNQLFIARTARLFNQLDEANIQDYLSGLVIGYEIRSLNEQHVYLVGGIELCLRYQQACTALNIDSSTISGDECFIQGLLQIKQDIENERKTSRYK